MTTNFSSTALSWIVGLAVALVFGLIAYLYYEVAVFIGMTSIGFVLGTGAMAFLGITWSWLVILVGVITAAVLAVVAIVGDMPMVLLTVLTALAGATVVTTGLMLLSGAVDIADFDSAATTEGVNDDWWWYAIVHRPGDRRCDQPVPGERGAGGHVARRVARRRRAGVAALMARWDAHGDRGMLAGPWDEMRA